MYPVDVTDIESYVFCVKCRRIMYTDHMPKHYCDPYWIEETPWANNGIHIAFAVFGRNISHLE